MPPSRRATALLLLSTARGSELPGSSLVCSEVSRDPHINFAHGGRADFRGRNGRYYCFLSAPNLAVNVRTEESEFTLHGGKLVVNGSFISEVHLVARVGGKKRKWANVSYWAKELGDGNWGWRQVSGTCGGGAPFRLGKGGYRTCEELEISVKMSSVDFVLRGRNWSTTVRGNRVYDRISGLNHRLDVSFNALGDAAARDLPHGIIGQSFSSPAPRFGMVDEYPEEGRFTTTAMAEGAIEGEAALYEVATPHETAFAFSRFEAARLAAPLSRLLPSDAAASEVGFEPPRRLQEPCPHEHPKQAFLVASMPPNTHQTLTSTVHVPYFPDMKAGRLLQMLGAWLQVHPDYIVVEFLCRSRPSFRTIEGAPATDSFGTTTIRVGAMSSMQDYAAGNSKTLHEYGLFDGAHISVELRPLRGDHLHQAFAIYIQNFHGEAELVDIMWDADFIGAPFASEGHPYPQTFANLSQGFHDYHILQVKPHFGVHSGQAGWFGDGLIHVHPGTSWGWFQHTEGYGANLGQYLEQVNVAYWETKDYRYPVGGLHVPTGNVGKDLTLSAMTFPNSTGGAETMVGGVYDCRILQTERGPGEVPGTKGQNIDSEASGKKRHPLRDFETRSHTGTELQNERILVSSNATHVWRVYAWDYYDSPGKEVSGEGGVNSQWLRHNLGMYSFSYEPRSQAAKPEDHKPPQCMIDVLVNQAAHS